MVATRCWCSRVADPPPRPTRSSRKRLAAEGRTAGAGLMPKKGSISGWSAGSWSGSPRAKSGDRSQCRFSFSSSTTGSAATSSEAHLAPR
eukprot:scaffold58990_cov22-Tisochrysis_lutea.AAC.3